MNAKDDAEQDKNESGQRSEVGSLAESGTVFPEDAVAGYPLDDDEGGDGLQEGSAGPNARTGDEDVRAKGER
jgi:hypothetical protein